MTGPSPLLLEASSRSRTKTGRSWPGEQPHDGARAGHRSERLLTSQPVDAVLPGAYDLLSAVLSRQTAEALPVVQFLPFGGDEHGHHCVRLLISAFVAASATAYGRTLLLDVSGAAGSARRQDFGSLPADSDPLTLRRAITPDMARPGLHYAAAHPRCAADLHDLVAKVSRSTTAQASPFRMIVLHETMKLARERALLMSAGCTATVPVAVAGVSRLPQMRETLRRLQAAGANLTGTVLVQVPRRGWILRGC